jgi:hypothetical protein
MIADEPRNPAGIGVELNKTLDKSMVDFNLKALAMLGTIFYKPLATASDPFFRKKMGERYFTGFSMVMGGILWLVAGRLSGWTDSLLQVFAATVNCVPLFRFATWLNEHNFGSVISLCVAAIFFGLAKLNLAATQQRQATGERWHSMSRGESLFGSENSNRDFIITCLVGLPLLVFAVPVGVLFIVSRGLSLHLVAQEQASVYARFLDHRDKEIEDIHFGRALKEGVPPQLTEGLYGPLPERFKGEHRKNVAWVAAGGPWKAPIKDESATTSRMPATIATPVVIHTAKGGDAGGGANPSGMRAVSPSTQPQPSAASSPGSSSESLVIRLIPRPIRMRLARMFFAMAGLPMKKD